MTATLLETPAMSPDVDQYIAGAADQLRPIAQRVRELITDELPDADEGFSWSRPIYKLNGKHVCYFTVSTGHVTLGFSHGRSLSDPDGVLEGEGTQMAHIKLAASDEIDQEQLREWLQQARHLAT